MQAQWRVCGSTVNMPTSPNLLEDTSRAVDGMNGAGIENENS